MLNVKIYNFIKEGLENIYDNLEHPTIENGMEGFSENSALSLLKNTKRPSYISFDGNGIDLSDETKFFFPYNNNYVGYIAAYESGDGCEYEVNVPSLYIEQYGASEKIEPFPMDRGMTIEFYGDCCTEITVDYLDKNLQEIASSTIVVNGDYVNIPKYYDYDIYGVFVRFTKTKLPRQLIKFYSIKFGDVITLNKFKSAELLEQINVISEDLPANSFDFESIYDGNEPLTIYDEAEIVVLSNGKNYGSFYVDDWKRTSKNSYSVRSLSASYVLGKHQFTGFSALAVRPDFDWFESLLELETGVVVRIDDTSGNIIIPSAIGIQSFREALCKIAFSANLMIDDSRSDVIRLLKIPTVIKSEILTSSKRIIGNCELSKTQQINNMTVKYIPDDNSFYAVGDKIIKLGNVKNVRTVYLFENPVNLSSLDDSVITVYGYSSRYIDFVATKDDCEIRVNEWVYGQTTSVIENEKASKKTKNDVDYSKFDVSAYVDGEERYPQNKREDLLKNAQSEGTITAKIVLNDERVGDLIKIETAYDGVKTGIITSMNIHFGYKDVADIEVLEWNTTGTI